MQKTDEKPYFLKVKLSPEDQDKLDFLHLYQERQKIENDDGSVSVSLRKLSRPQLIIKMIDIFYRNKVKMVSDSN